MKPNLGFYVQKINDIVQETEAVGEGMNPSYEELRQAIDNQTTNELSVERLAEIKDIFFEGTKKYESMLATVRTLRPPARVMGIHKKFEQAYVSYVEGCTEMTSSISNEQLDTLAFDAAEKKQDDATEVISFAIQRMTALVLKR